MTFKKNIRRLSRKIALATPWQRAAIAFFAGALSALAMAPINAWPILFIALPAMVWLVDGCVGSFWRCVWLAARLGWCFGFGYFLFGLYWIGYAFLVDAKTFGWLLPIAVIGLPAYLAIYPALGLAGMRCLWLRGPLRILAFASMLTLAEWLRGHLLSGFPWNTFGYAFAKPLVLAQGVSLIGIWGFTFLVLAVCASPAVFGDNKQDTPRPFRFLLMSGVVLAVLIGYGTIRLWSHPTEFISGLKLRIVQPNIQQDEKFNYNAKDRVMAHYLKLSRTHPDLDSAKHFTLLIWPETAFPFFLTREPAAVAQIAALLNPNAELITGAVRAAETQAGSRPTTAYNSLYVISADGSVRATYDKVHLVPFGEYLPFQELLEKLGLQQLTKQAGGLLAGNRRRTIELTNAPAMLPLICYEVIFPDTAIPAGERPGWLINLTNDGWFGISSGPYQHLQQATMLAIAEGLPLVRAANTGVSMVIDPVGRTINKLPLGSEGVLDSELPRRLQPTTYKLVGDGPTALFLVVSFVLLVRRRVHADTASLCGQAKNTFRPMTNSNTDA